MSRFAAIAGATVASVLAAAGCSSGPKSARHGPEGEPLVRGAGNDPGQPLTPGTLSVSTNNAMPVLRVEAFKSGR